MANTSHTQNQLQTHTNTQHVQTQHLSSSSSSNILTAATVLMELPQDDMSNAVGNMQYTLPPLTKNATTNTNTTTIHKPQATTIQIVKQSQTQRHVALHHCIDAQSIVRHVQQPGAQQQTQQQAQPRQEYIKIDTSRLEDKMLLRDVMQYGSTSITMSHSAISEVITSTNVVAHESELLLADTDDTEHELELAAIKSDHVEALLDEDYDDKLHEDVEQHEKMYVNGMTEAHAAMLGHHSMQDDNDQSLNDDTKFVCNVCGKTYKIKGSLKRHKNYECGVEPTLKCPHCPHKCKYKSDLRKHVNQKHTESGETSVISN